MPLDSLSAILVPAVRVPAAQNQSRQAAKATSRVLKKELLARLARLSDRETKSTYSLTPVSQSGSVSGKALWCSVFWMLPKATSSGSEKSRQFARPFSLVTLADLAATFTL